MEEIITQLRDNIVDLIHEREHALTIEACVDIDTAIDALVKAQASMSQAVQHDAQCLSRGLTALQYDGVTGEAYSQYVGALA